jgi:hypothetical protein
MFAYFTADHNLPFSIALTVMVFIALLEGVGILFGLGLSSLLETILPNFDVDLNVDFPDSDAPALSRFLGWLRIGQVPALIILIVLLTCFGLSGLFLQSFAQNTFGAMLPTWFASAAAFAVSLPAVRLVGGVLARILPKDETSAVSEQSFIGRVGTITLGTARHNSPAEAKLVDEYGQTHYIMVAPDLPEDEFKQGDQVLIVHQAGSLFHVIPGNKPGLTDS